MLQAITTEGMVQWECMGGEEDEWCSAPLSAHASETVYQLPPPGSHASDTPYIAGREVLYKKHPLPGRGSVIALPACHECGAQCFLKADYTLKELYRATTTILDSESNVVGYSLKMGHVHNLLLHHYLYSQGMAEHAPILGLPAQEELSSPTLAALPANVVLSLWFGHKVVQWKHPLVASFAMVTAKMAALPVSLALPAGEK